MRALHPGPFCGCPLRRLYNRSLLFQFAFWTQPLPLGFEKAIEVLYLLVRGALVPPIAIERGNYI